MDEKEAILTGKNIERWRIDSQISMRTKILKTSLEKVCFPNQINLAEATPVFKKEDELSKENYRPISVVSHAFKIFERIVFKGNTILYKENGWYYIYGYI